MDKMYVVEVIRYGEPSLGVQLFGVFAEYESINETMKEYNSFRGGKYPEYFVTETFLNPTDIKPSKKMRFNINGDAV